MITIPAQRPDTDQQRTWAAAVTAGWHASANVSRAEVEQILRAACAVLNQIGERP